MRAKTLLATLACIAVGSQAVATGFSFTFDNDSEGWTKGDFGNGFGNISTGNTAAVWENGMIKGSDHSSYAYHFSPNLGGGHGGLFGQNLSLDFRSTNAGGNDPFLVLVSSTDFLVLEKTIPSSANLVSYQFALDASEPWYFNSSEYHNGGNAVVASNSQILSVLNDLQYVGISTDIADGGDLTYTDNVQAVPEPATLAALALGAVCLIRRRR
ncbi:MAG TPA: PEP-CTERM sorting domain-containing protein [Fimbriimonadaceae bacterium]|nr:PEP-CTERM sorting domain-containing protein [Fimbriimonadaceae bacterium]